MSFQYSSEKKISAVAPRKADFFMRVLGDEMNIFYPSSSLFITPRFVRLITSPEVWFQFA